MLTTRRGFFGALAALVGVTATGRVLEARSIRETAAAWSSLPYGDGTVGGINRATFSFWRNQQVSDPEFYNSRTFFDSISKDGFRMT